MKQLIECVPNFSEGNNLQIIERIVEEIKSVEGVKVIDVDSGKATNRTVVTFVEAPGSTTGITLLAASNAISESLAASRWSILSAFSSVANAAAPVLN